MHLAQREAGPRDTDMREAGWCWLMHLAQREAGPRDTDMREAGGCFQSRARLRKLLLEGGKGPRASAVSRNTSVEEVGGCFGHRVRRALAAALRE